jgi:hypothetical protein
MRRGQRHRMHLALEIPFGRGRHRRAAGAVIGDDLALALRLDQRKAVAADAGRLRLDHAEQRAGRHRRVRRGAAGAQHLDRGQRRSGCEVATIAFWAWTVERPAKWKFLMRSLARLGVCLGRRHRAPRAGPGFMAYSIPGWAMLAYQGLWLPALGIRCPLCGFPLPGRLINGRHAATRSPPSINSPRCRISGSCASRCARSAGSGLKGSVLLAHEGINGTLAGSARDRRVRRTNCSTARCSAAGSTISN